MTWSGVWVRGRLLCGVAVGLFSVTGSARADLGTSLELANNVSAVRARLELPASSDLAEVGLRDEWYLKATAASQALRNSWSAEAVLTYEPDPLNAQDAILGLGVEADDNRPLLPRGDRFLGQVVLGATLHPIEPLALKLGNTFQVSTAADPAGGLSGVLLPEASAEPASVQTGATGLTYVPQNAWTNTVSVGTEWVPGLPISPGSGIQYQVSAPLTCLDAEALGGSDAASVLTLRNRWTDTSTVRLHGLTGPGEHLLYGGGGRYSLERSQPIQRCSDGGQRQRLHQGVLGGMLVSRLSTRVYLLELGGIVYGGATTHLESGVTDDVPVGVKPAVGAQIIQIIPRGNVRAAVSSEVSILPGLENPTYNLMAGLQAQFSPDRVWSVQLQASTLRANALSTEALPVTAGCATRAQLYSLSAGLGFSPVWWLKSEVSYSGSSARSGLNSGCADADGETAAGPERLTLHTVSTRLSFRWDAGFLTRGNAQLAYGF